MSDDSPYQDAKDFKASVKQAAKKADDFAKHSTAKVLGPLATRTLGGLKLLLKRWTTHQEPDDGVDEV